MSIEDVKINTVPVKEAASKVCVGVENGNKITATSRLSTFKLKTIMGKKLPQEDIPVVTALVKEMHRKNWLSPENKNWCLANGISFN